MRARFLVVFIWVVCAGPVEPRRARDVKSTQGYARGYYAPHPPHYAYLGLPYAAVRSRFKVRVGRCYYSNYWYHPQRGCGYTQRDLGKYLGKSFTGVVKALWLTSTAYF